MIKYLQLQEDVENPIPDKRSKFDWRKAPMFPAGTKLAQDTKTKQIFPVDAVGATLTTDDVRAKKILKKVTPFEPDAVEIMSANQLTSGKVLNRLLKKGLVSTEDILKVSK